MTPVEQPGRFTTLPEEETLSATVALEEHGFSVEVVDDRDAARGAVLARIPEGSSNYPLASEASRREIVREH